MRRCLRIIASWPPQKRRQNFRQDAAEISYNLPVPATAHLPPSLLACTSLNSHSFRSIELSCVFLNSHSFVIHWEFQSLPKMRTIGLLLLAACSTVFGQISVANTATCASDGAAAAATAKTESPTSNVCGRAFDRIMMVYLETTMYSNAIADRKWVPTRMCVYCWSSL